MTRFSWMNSAGACRSRGCHPLWPPPVHLLGPFARKKGVHSGLIEQVQLLARPHHKVARSGRAQAPDDRGTDEAAMARNVDTGVEVHQPYSEITERLEPFTRDDRIAACDLHVRGHHLANEVVEAVFGRHPSLCLALEGSPSSVSTSVGLK